MQSLKNQKKPIEFKENLQPNDLEFEHIFLSLRTYQGLDLQLFLNEFGYGFLEKYKKDYIGL